MIPLAIDAKELKMLTDRTRQVADEVLRENRVRLNYLVGTMIETPRAAITAEKIAEVADFFSFGTNDLTQMTMGLSRDDAGRFLPVYVDQSKAAIFAGDPFQTIDRDGVGKLVSCAIRSGRGTKPKLKVGICGEHGGETKSVYFCHEAGMNYVSCSPYRVPIARLAAAQAAIMEAPAGRGRKAKKRAKKAKAK
jgi:pyruvate,orthophosphate dikinase